MVTLIVLIVSVLIICGMLLYIRSIQRLMDKKDEECRTKEAEMLKQAEEQAKKIAILKSLVDSQDKILAIYRDEKK
jgi:predicted Holliday junction resolvase-like endonuclease